MNRRLLSALRAGILLGLAGIVPACGSTKVPPPLFQDGFSAYPNANWTGPTLVTATAAPDPAAGLPSPSLKMAATAAGGSVLTATTAAFNNPSMTVSVNMANSSALGTDLGSARISIVNATPTVLATADWDNTSGIITFHINGGAVDATSAVLPANGAFHRIVFSVSAGGIATWSLDNGAALVTQAAFPAGLLTVRLSAAFGGGTAWPSFFFDNVTVTSP